MAIDIDIAAFVFALVFGILASHLDLLQLWAFYRPNGKTGKRLRSTTIVKTPSVTPRKPTAWQRKTHGTQQLTAKRLGILVRQGQRKAVVDERILLSLETLVTEQRTRPSRNFRASATEVLGADFKCPWPRGRNLPERSAGKVELPPVRGAGYEPSASSGEPTGVAHDEKRDGGREIGEERRRERDWGRETGEEKRKRDVEIDM